MKSLISPLLFIWRHPLNRPSRLQAIFRFFRWQLASRLLPGAAAVPFVGEARLLMEKGMTGATGNWYCGLHEYEEMGFILHVLRPGEIFVDVGANVGSYSILAAGGVGACAVAIEPIPSTYAKLLRNIGLNRLESLVRPVRCGVSFERGTLAFTASLDTVNHVLADKESADSIDVEVIPLDDLVPELNAVAIKIDVEGHEISVLKGASKLLASDALLAVVVETNSSGKRYGAEDSEIFDLMASFGFSPYQYDPVSRSFQPSSGDSANTIFARDLDLLVQRVRSAPRFLLVNGMI